MINDDDLLAYARHSDPETSHAAAAALDAEQLSKLQSIVLEALSKAQDGLTVPEIAAAVGLPRDTISPRMKPLLNAKAVTRLGDKRQPPGHRIKCLVWRIARRPE